MKSRLNRASPKKHSSNPQELVERARALSRAGKGRTRLESALGLLRQAAALGSAEADYAIGTWYLFGRYVPKSLADAERHIRKAAKAGYPAALFDLAVMCETGRGAPKDKVRAFELYLRAALRGDSDAIESVARCVYHGIGTAKNRGLGSLLQDYAAIAPRTSRKKSK
jgi:TPR repeat protein